MAFMMGQHLLVIDSFQFMSQSLERLASNLEDFPVMKRELASEQAEIIEVESMSVEEQMEILSRKAVYPYDYMNKCEKFEEKMLPPNRTVLQLA